jgi:hypothetical protein
MEGYSAGVIGLFGPKYNWSGRAWLCRTVLQKWLERLTGYYRGFVEVYGGSVEF